MPSTEVRDRVQLHAEEARVVFNIFDNHFRITQRVRRLQFIARIGHFSDQTANPGVQLQFKQATILRGTDVFALNQLQVSGQPPALA